MRKDRDLGKLQHTVHIELRLHERGFCVSIPDDMPQDFKDELQYAVASVVEARVKRAEEKEKLLN